MLKKAEEEKELREKEAESRKKSTILFKGKSMQPSRQYSPMQKCRLNFGETYRRGLSEKSDGSIESHKTNGSSNSSTSRNETKRPKSTRKDRKKFRDCELKELKELVQRTSGKKITTGSSTTRFSDTSFASWILKTKMPKRFNVTNMKPYEGTLDPEDHIAEFKNRIRTCNIPEEDMETEMCKGFGYTLIGMSQRWFSTLPERSIKSFSFLAKKLVNNFSDNMKKENDVDDLYDMRQGTNHQVSQVRRVCEEI